MDFSPFERDLLGEIALDSHELWEVYAYVRLYNPNASEDEVLSLGYKFIKDWIAKGWLKASRSRDDPTKISEEDLIELVNRLGHQATDPNIGIILIDPTEHALEWISKHGI